MTLALDPLATYGVAELGRLVWDLGADRAGRRIKTLRQQYGFPPPIPGPGRKRWLGSAVIGWLETPPVEAGRAVGAAGQAVPTAENGVVDYSVVLRARLQRLREGAGGHSSRRS